MYNILINVIYFWTALLHFARNICILVQIPMTFGKNHEKLIKNATVVLQFKANDFKKYKTSFDTWLDYKFIIDFYTYILNQKFRIQISIIYALLLYFFSHSYLCPVEKNISL